MLLHRALGPSKVLTAVESCEAFGRDDSEASPTTPDIVTIETILFGVPPVAVEKSLGARQ